MYDDPAKITLSEDSQFSDLLSAKTYFKEFVNAKDKLGPAMGVRNGIIASVIILLPLIALVIWL